ncbi:hypothetical protein [Actinacidiphila yeochonensis]
MVDVWPVQAAPLRVKAVGAGSAADQVPCTPKSTEPPVARLAL